MIVDLTNKEIDLIVSYLEITMSSESICNKNQRKIIYDLLNKLKKRPL